MILMKNILDLDPFSLGVIIQNKDDLFYAEKNPGFKLIQNVLNSMLLTCSHLNNNSNEYPE